MKQKDHLPFFGIGPYYVGIIAILTVVSWKVRAQDRFLPNSRLQTSQDTLQALNWFLIHASRKKANTARLNASGHLFATK